MLISIHYIRNCPYYVNSEKLQTLDTIIDIVVKNPDSFFDEIQDTLGANADRIARLPGPRKSPEDSEETLKLIDDLLAELGYKAVKQAEVLPVTEVAQDDEPTAA